MKKSTVNFYMMFCIMLISKITFAQIGIGTQTPTKDLEIVDTDTSEVEILGALESNLWLNATLPAIRFNTNNDFNGSIEWASGAMRFYTGKNYAGNLITPLMSLHQNNRIGIGLGLAVAQQQLDVGGKIKIGNDGSTPQPGTMRYFNGNFEGYDGSQWELFNDIAGNTGIPEAKIEFGANPNEIRFVVEDNFISTQTNTMIFDGQVLDLPGSNTVIGKDTEMFTSPNVINNVYIGAESGLGHSRATNNTAIGYRSGNSTQFNMTRNTHIGSTAGYNSVGSGNVFLGYQAGWGESVSDKLYISNTATSAPLILGDFATNEVTVHNRLNVAQDLVVVDSTIMFNTSIQSPIPALEFVDTENSSGNPQEEKWSIRLNHDQLTVYDGNTQVLIIVGGNLYIPSLSGGGTRNLSIDNTGKIIAGP